MKIPHPLFVLINKVMVAVLASPLHAMFSRSVLAIRYTGVKSGRTFTVPARYLGRNGEYYLVTSKDTRWWPNFSDGLNVLVLLGGKWVHAQAHASCDDPNLAGPLMRALWAAHPADASYMNVNMVAGEPDAGDFERALRVVVVVRIVPL